MSDAEAQLVRDLAAVVKEYRDLIVAGEKLPDGKIPDRRIRIEVRGLDRLLKKAASRRPDYRAETLAWRRVDDHRGTMDKCPDMAVIAECRKHARQLRARNEELEVAGG